MRSAYIGLATLASIATPAHGEWAGMIFDRGEVRQASLRGMDDAEPHRQISLLCSTAGDYYRLLSVIVALPATGQYAVRHGDIAQIDLSMGDLAWTFDVTVENNGTSGFVASADIDVVLEIVQAIEAAQAEMTASITVGPIDQSFVVSDTWIAGGPGEWLDACGR